MKIAGEPNYSQPDCMKQCTDDAGYFKETGEENLGVMKATAVIMIVCHRTILVALLIIWLLLG